MKILSWMIAIFINFYVSAGTVNFSQINECIVEGSNVQLVGQLVSRTTSSNQNLEGKAETYWYLDTEKAYCGEGYNAQTKALSRVETSCSRFQLKLSQEQLNSQRILLGKKVIVEGQIMIAKSKNEQTKMLIDVNDIELELAE